MSSTKSGDVGDWLRIEGVVTALYGVPALQKIRRPSMIGFRSNEIRRIVSIEE
jgi:hypothetical protein